MSSGVIESPKSLGLKPTTTGTGNVSLTTEPWHGTPPPNIPTAKTSPTWSNQLGRVAVAALGAGLLLSASAGLFTESIFVAIGCFIVGSVFGVCVSMKAISKE